MRPLGARCASPPTARQPRTNPVRSRPDAVMRGRLTFGLLGALAAHRGSEPLGLGGRQQRAVLAMLLLHANEAVAVERLIDDLWPSPPPPTAGVSLQNQIARLRKLLEPERELLSTQPAGYRLAL